MKRYAIAFTDADGTAYWVTRFNESDTTSNQYGSMEAFKMTIETLRKTDNYTYDKNDATLFPDKSAARVLMKTLALDGDHEIIELEV